jgi:hypothetical protein
MELYPTELEESSSIVSAVLESNDYKLSFRIIHVPITNFHTNKLEYKLLIPNCDGNLKMSSDTPNFCAITFTISPHFTNFTQ